MANLDSVIEFCEERMGFKPFVAQVNHGALEYVPDDWPFMDPKECEEVDSSMILLDKVKGTWLIK